ncbi:protein mago nashi [Angomonas deanei]|nr:protein mago nashi [Angomonas deanei]EPY31175.1 protein mago nashi [Angomonas deanei]|eukprot:EPY30651.1 protein mago nashi [Angomonas deanei]
MTLSPDVLAALKHIIEQSSVMDCDDERWPEPDRNGRQELEIHLGNVHASFLTNKIISIGDVESGPHSGGLTSFYYAVRDLKMMILTLVSIHFKIKST